MKRVVRYRGRYREGVEPRRPFARKLGKGNGFYDSWGGEMWFHVQRISIFVNRRHQLRQFLKSVPESMPIGSATASTAGSNFPRTRNSAHRSLLISAAKCH